MSPNWECHILFKPEKLPVHKLEFQADVNQSPTVAVLPKQMCTISQPNAN